MSRDVSLSELFEVGFTILPAVISPSEALSLGNDLMERVEQLGVPGDQRGYLGNCLTYANSIEPLVTNKVVLDLARLALGDGFRASMVTGTVHYPGMVGGGFHRDWPHKDTNAFYVPISAVRVPIHIIAIWMLSEFTIENGGTSIIAGSHLLEGAALQADATSRSIAGESNAVGAPGSVLMMDARLLHAISANNSSRPRVALICRYASSWLNLNALNQDALDSKYIVKCRTGNDPKVARLRLERFESFSEATQSLVYPLV